MATANLRPRHLAPYGDYTPHPGAYTLTGTEPALADGDDSTYVTMDKSTVGGLVMGVSPLDVLDAGGTVTAVTLHLRMSGDPSYFNPDAYSQFVIARLGLAGDDILLGDTGTIIQIAPAGTNNPVLSTAGLTDMVIPVTDSDMSYWVTSLATIEAALRAGAQLGIEQNSVGYWSVYEAWLEVTTAGSFPLRRYPPVNNGGSGPTRHYPRAVNRRAGGTY